MKKKNNTRRITSFLLALLLLVVMIPAEVFALTINGEGAGIGGATSTASSAYAAYGIKYGYTPGYRITLVDSTGARKYKSYDVYDYTAWDSIVNGNGLSPINSFADKLTKMEWIPQYKSVVANASTNPISLASVTRSNFFSQSNVKKDTDLGVDFPSTTTSMVAWVEDTKMDTLVYNIWGIHVTDLQKNGWCVAFEPIYIIKAGGAYFSGTVTELAIFSVADGTAYSGVSSSEIWDYIPSTAGSASNSWNYIAGYTHASWPKSLKLSSNQFGIAGGSNLRTLYKYGETGYVNRLSGGSASEIVEGGYGMMVVFDDYIGNYIVKYDGNGATGGSTADSFHSFNVSKNLTANGFTRTGYTFTGWNTKADGTGTSYTDQQSVVNLTTEDGGTVTLYAQWVESTVNQKVYVRYQNSDGSWGSYSLVIDENYTKGSTFPGWSRAADTTYKAASLASYTVTEAKTSYVDVYRQQYTVTLTKGTGIASVSGAGTYYAGQNVTINATVSTGYTWSKWSGTHNTTTQKYTFAIYSNVSDTANATANSYTLTVNPNGGTWNGTTSNSTFTMSYGSTKTISNPTRTGYTFAGWTVSGGGSMSGTTYTQGASNCTLTANWTAASVNYTVKHWLMNANGSGYTEDTSAKETRTATTGTTITISDLKKTYAGFTYDCGKIGNSTTASSSATVLADGSLVINLYYTRNQYNLTVKPNGGIWNKTTNDSSFSLYYQGTKTIADPTRTGYTFAGWTSTVSGVLSGTTYTQPASAVTLTASWNPIIYTITCDKQSGSNGTSTFYEKYATGYYSDSSAATVITAITPPTRTGYTFGGYYTGTNGTGTQVVNASGTIMTANTYFTSNTTVYAYWIPVVYTITCDPQGGSGSSRTAVFYEKYDVGFYSNVGCTTALSKVVAPTKTGYTFDGYYTGTGGTGVRIVDANGSVLVDSKYFTSNTTIYAHWTANTYTINCEKNGGSNGTSTFYELYNNKFYINTSTKDAVTAITVPTRAGYTFLGYYTQDNADRTLTATSISGTQIVDASGNIKAANTYYNDSNTTNGVATVYACWSVNYDVELVDIIFKSALNPDVEMTADELTQVPYGTKVYVLYKYRNNSPVSVNVTGYNTNGNAISYNGSTSYAISAGGTLTVQAGSFVASPLGPGVITGAVYITGYTNANNEVNLNLSGTAAQTNNTRSESYTVKHDLYIADVYVTHNSADGPIVSMDALIVGETYYVHHVYGNNAYVDVTVNGYNDSTKFSYNGSAAFTVPAQGTVDVVAMSYTPTEGSTVGHTAKVYRNGMTDSTEKYETSLTNNVYTYTLGTIQIPYLEVIEQNSPYRANTEVITSYWLHNVTDRDYTTDDCITVRMRVYDTVSGDLLLTMTQDVIVPANETQLVYFKWEVPEISRYQYLKIVADIQLPWIGMDTSSWLSEVSDQYRYSSWNVYYTPDTEYEPSAPANWFVPQKPNVVTSTKTWYQWTYSNGTFTKVDYGITATPGTVTLTPASTTAYQDDSGVWYMKSGYGFYLNATNATITVASGYTMPSTDAYTNVQYNYIAYPEFSYNTTYIDTVEEVIDGNWQLYEFMTYGRKHHTPIWYPDGEYVAMLWQTDLWTPMGMITISGPSTAIVIEGDMYDDWYIGHG